jgi:hypothetical protein
VVLLEGSKKSGVDPVGAEKKVQKFSSKVLTTDQNGDRIRFFADDNKSATQEKAGNGVDCECSLTSCSQ